jgi:hypothetical protein
MTTIDPETYSDLVGQTGDVVCAECGGQRLATPAWLDEFGEEWGAAYLPKAVLCIDCGKQVDIETKAERAEALTSCVCPGGDPRCLYCGGASGDHAAVAMDAILGVLP